MIHLARVVGIEGKGFAGEIHLLQFILLFPGAVFHRQVDVGAVAAAGIGENPCCRIPQRHALGRRLLKGVAAHEVYIQGLIGLSCHLHALVDQAHLVDEEVAEYPTAVHHHIDAGPAQLLKGDQLQFVYPAEGVGHGPDADKPEDLG